jgi:hypothetical protein
MEVAASKSDAEMPEPQSKQTDETREHKPPCTGEVEEAHTRTTHDEAASNVVGDEDQKLLTAHPRL